MEEVVTSLIPSLVKNGVFGDGEFVSIGADENSDKDAQFSSELALVDLKLRISTGEFKVIHLVIKMRTNNPLDQRDPNTMFYNEIKMYEEILPFLNQEKKPRYPKFYYGKLSVTSDGPKDFLILENLRTYGFELCRQRVFLDYDHIVLAMIKLGELHAWSYTWKGKNMTQFMEYANKLKKLVDSENVTEDIQHVNFRRGVKHWLAIGVEVELLNKFLKALKRVYRFAEFVHAGVEPFAVIIHGDYNKNNIQYKYDENGKPIDCVYFDFQGTRYGSPAVDLAFFLYMHTTKETRAHWDTFLQIYWKSVEDNVSGGVRVPSFEEFSKYFATKAVLGYYPCTFFFAVMLFPEDLIPLDKFFKLSFEEQAAFCENFGGEVVTNLLQDIVAHLLEKKYIHSFLDYYEKEKPY